MLDWFYTGHQLSNSVSIRANAGPSSWYILSLSRNRINGVSRVIAVVPTFYEVVAGRKTPKPTKLPVVKTIEEAKEACRMHFQDRPKPNRNDACWCTEQEMCGNCILWGQE